MDNLDNIDFKKLASQQKSIQMKMRLLALAHFKDGHSRTQIAKFLKVRISGYKLSLKKDLKDYTRNQELGDPHSFLQSNVNS